MCDKRRRDCVIYQRACHGRARPLLYGGTSSARLPSDRHRIGLLTGKPAAFRQAGRPGARKVYRRIVRIVLPDAVSAHVVADAGETRH